MTNLLADFDIAKSNIKKLLAEDSHSSMDEQSQNTWRIVANELYIKHRAYSVEFELTNDHEKNCGARVASELRGILDGRGGCYHRDGPYKNKIFMSPELPPQQALWIANHEYAHWLQDRRGNSYIEDKECDADLQALEYVGYFVGGFGRYCKNIGIEIQDISREELEKMKLDWTMG